MKKEIFLIVFIIFIIFFIIIFNKNVYAVVSNMNNLKLSLSVKISANRKKEIDEDVEQQVVEELQKVYGYQGTELIEGTSENTMEFRTKIFILEEKNGKYTIQIGGAVADKKKKVGTVVKKVSEKDLIKKYGYDKNSGESSWDVVLLGCCTYDSGAFNLIRK